MMPLNIVRDGGCRQEAASAEARRTRIAISVAIGVTAGAAALLLHPAMAHDDFYQIWAGAVVFGAANLALAWALQAGEQRRLLMFASAAWIDAAVFTQWSPLLTTPLLLPSLGWAYAMKPNLGLALFLSRPTRAALIGSVAALALSLVLPPTWPRDWLEAIRQAPHIREPIATVPGPVVALALLRWRRFDARRLLALASVPQTSHRCGTLPLFLIPGTRAGMLLLVGASYGCVLLTRTLFIPATYAQSFVNASPLVVLLIYVPCLVMILRRPNEGTMPTLPLGRARG